MTKKCSDKEAFLNKKTIKILELLSSNLKSDSMELQLLDICFSKVDSLTIQKLDDETIKKIKSLDVIDDDSIKKQAINNILEQRDEMLKERCSIEFSIDELCKIFELDSKEITHEKLTKMIDMFIKNLHIQEKNIPIFIERTYNPLLGIKLVVNYLIPEIRELFFDEKEDLLVSSLLNCYFRTISAFQFALERKMTDSEIIQVGFWCQKYGEDRVQRALYLSERERFMQSREKIFFFIEEILKICYDGDIKPERFFDI